MTASYIIKTKLRRHLVPLAHYRPSRPRRWSTRANASSIDAARLIAGQAGLRSTPTVEAAVFHRGKIVAKLALVLAALVLAGCARRNVPTWIITHDPGGLGYWAAPAGEEPRFYPSAYSNPIVNQTGGPDR